MRPQPPRRALHFLRWFCRLDYLEEIEGDLTEIFIKESHDDPKRAKRKFYWGVLRHFRPEFIKTFKSRYLANIMDMLRHNLLISLRNFLRYKSSFAINLFGLASGLTCALLIYLWIDDELKIDRFHEKDAQLYQVLQQFHNGNDISTIEYTPGMLAKTLEDEFPEVERAVSLVPSYWFGSEGIVSSGTIRMRITPQFVSKGFFDIFSYPVIEGNKDHLFSNKQGVMISESLAKRIFNSTSAAVGKSLKWNQLNSFDGEYFVTGVFKDVPQHSSLKFDILFNWDLFVEKRPAILQWGNSDPNTYVLLKEGTDIERFENKVRDLKRQRTQNPKEGTFIVNQFSSQYLYGNYQLEHGGNGGGRIVYVRLFGIIAIFILLIACINFMNLSTAQATRRLKEVGVKKAIGAGRRALVAQYLGEALLVTFFAALISCALVYLFLPVFNNITGKHLIIDFDLRLISAITLILAITGILAGSYPALYLSKFNPVMIMKGRMNVSFGEVWARKGLVVFQFTLSVILIVSVLIVYKQIDFIQSKNLGYNRDNVIYFEPEWKGDGSLQSFLTEVEKIPGVVSVSCYYHNLLGDHGGTTDIQWEGKDPDTSIDFANLEVGFDFIETLGIGMAAGTTFSRDIKPDHQIILNEEAVRQMGLSDPVGKVIKLWGEEKTIVGVAKNFNFESLYEEIKPCFFQVYAELPNTLVRIQAGTEQETIARLDKLYRQFNPGLAFDFKFLDTSYQALYVSEHRIGILSRYFAFIAILISCLGLFGLAAFTAERRVKEIGIRKIMGASTTGIITLLTADFTKMVLAAIVVAIPISYYLGFTWLQNFAYRIELEWWFFAGAGITALLIAWLTVVAQTIRAAQVNSAECLRSE
jgi:putative ABC transport system permease protein